MPDIYFKCYACGKHLVADDAGIGVTITLFPPAALVLVLSAARAARSGVSVRRFGDGVNLLFQSDI